MSADNRSKSIVPEVLILASRYDLTCDYVIAKLRRRSVTYLRLNVEDLSKSALDLDPVNRCLLVDHAGHRYHVTPDRLVSVLFRRPVYLRDYGDDQRSPAERFSRLQWAAFIQNLMLFDQARWFNDPAATYRAEHKALQLSVASQLGFAVPMTHITNAPDASYFKGKVENVAVKGLDTVMLRENGYEMFGFTTFEDIDRLEAEDWRAAPATIQGALNEKLDLRITVIEDEVFAASITVDGERIRTDWREQKSGVRYQRFDLPRDVRSRCVSLVRALGLRFGGIDLALCEDTYYFLEINPTGEWAWLVDAAGFPIDDVLAKALSKEECLDAV